MECRNWVARCKVKDWLREIGLCSSLNRRVLEMDLGVASDWWIWLHWPSTQTNVYQICMICICICFCIFICICICTCICICICTGPHPDQCLSVMDSLYLQSTSLFLSNIISVSLPSMLYWSLQVPLPNLVWLEYFVETAVDIHTPDSEPSLIRDS